MTTIPMNSPTFGPDASLPAPKGSRRFTAQNILLAVHAGVFVLAGTASVPGLASFPSLDGLKG